MHQPLTLPGRKHLPGTGIQRLAIPERVSLLLDQHARVTLIPCVAPGERVQRGQPVAKSLQPLGAWLHAPCSGIVEQIDAAVMNAQGCTVQAIVIRSDAAESSTTSPVDSADKTDWRDTTPIALCEHLAQGGVVGLGGAVFPAATKLASHVTRRIDHLLINGAECEPYIRCDDALMRERASVIVQGVQILLHACDAPHALIAIEDDKPEAIASMQMALQQLGDERIAITIMPTQYPNGDEGQLIKRLLDLEIPRHCLPADIGVIVQNVATAHACAQWVLQGEPLISRIVTVTGLGISEPRNVEVPIGIECSTVMAACGGYRDAAALLVGGAMMGRAISSDAMPITKSVNCLVAAAPSELPPPSEEQPCIRCGDCMHACPVYLMPQQLWWHLRNDDKAALEEYGLRDCIECGCCDYVCPSHIRLASRFHDAKRGDES